MAPWATTEMRQDRADKLEQALNLVQEAGGCKKIVASLESNISVQQKAGEKAKGKHFQGVQATRGFISRQEKKQAELERKKQEIQDDIDIVDQNLAEARDRLRIMELEAA